jgi:hypothetical protein
MSTLKALLCWEGMLFLASLATIVLSQLLSGGINSRWLLFGRKNSDHYFSPGRVQLLVLTLGGAFNYLLTVLQAPIACSLPPVPQEWLAILGSSNGIYLAGKAYARFAPRQGRGQ